MNQKTVAMPYTWPLSVALPENSSEVTPKNMGTQCENFENVELGSENDPTKKRLWLRAVLKVKKYFGFGVHTSDPFLNVVKWIVYITEVLFIIISKETYFGSLQSFFLQIGATVAVALITVLIGAAVAVAFLSSPSNHHIHHDGQGHCRVVHRQPGQPVWWRCWWMSFISFAASSTTVALIIAVTAGINQTEEDI